MFTSHNSKKLTEFLKSYIPNNPYIEERTLPLHLSDTSNVTLYVYEVQGFMSQLPGSYPCPHVQILIFVL